MDRQAVFWAVSLLVAVFLSLGFMAGKRSFRSLSDFYLGGRRIRPTLIVSLLLSGSFSLNGMLYQIYLGYKVGGWALLTQVAWAVSFLLLSRFASKIVATSGLHHFLGSVYSSRTQRLAAICSIIGLCFQIGWEYSVARSAFSGLTDPPLAGFPLEIVLIAILAVTTFYTLFGGLRSNAWTDIVQNVLKVGCFAVLIALLFSVATEHPFTVISASTARPFADALKELTLIGLASNIIFSLAWQFVDMTTWQTIIAARETRGDQHGVKRMLTWAALCVFIAPGIIGTVIGIALNGQDLSADNVMPAILSQLGHGFGVVFMLTLAVAATLMSFIDGMMLAVSYTFISDLLFRRDVDRLGLLHRSEAAQTPGAERKLASIVTSARLAMAAVVVTATFLPAAARAYLDFDLFSLVYIVVVSQIAMSGPVLVSLLGRVPRPRTGIAAIGTALLAGYGAGIAGGLVKSDDLQAAAPIIAIIPSLAIAFVGSRSR